MRRPFGIGVLVGCAAVAVPVSIYRLATPRPVERYLRVADDSPLTAAGRDDPKVGPSSVRLMRSCGVSSIKHDAVRNDHAASAFVRLDQSSVLQINCMIGQARAQHLAIAVTDGFNASEIYDLAGDPVAYTRCAPERLIAGTCQTKSVR